MQEKKRFTPEGADEFFGVLSELNAPRSVAGSNARWISKQWKENMPASASDSSGVYKDFLLNNNQNPKQDNKSKRKSSRNRTGTQHCWQPY